MSGTARPVNAPARPVRRVRHDLRDGLAVMMFSATTSVLLAGVLLLLTELGK